MCFHSKMRENHWIISQQNKNTIYLHCNEHTFKKRCGISDHIPETTIKPIKFLCKFYSNDAFNNSHRDIQDNEETLGYDLKRNE